MTRILAALLLVAGCATTPAPQPAPAPHADLVVLAESAIVANAVRSQAPSLPAAARALADEELRAWVLVREVLTGEQGVPPGLRARVQAHLLTLPQPAREGVAPVSSSEVPQ